MPDSKSLEIERLQKKIEALKASFESKLKQKDAKLKQKDERIQKLKEEITQDKRLIGELTMALGVIAHQKRAMVLEAFKFVTDVDEPLAKVAMRYANAAAHRLATYARGVNRSRPERKTGGEKIGRQPENAIDLSGTAVVQSENVIDQSGIAVVQSEEAANRTENTVGNKEEVNTGIESASMDEVKPPRPAVALTKLTRQQKELIEEHGLQDESISVLQSNCPPVDCTEPPVTHRGRRLNEGELVRFDQTVLKPVTECPNCHTPLNAVDPKCQISYLVMMKSQKSS